MTIQSIIKKAVKRLELEGHLLTPDYYQEAFCKEAQKAGMDIEDCSQIKKHTATLNPDIQKELKQYRIKTMNEFTRFLVSKLNRTNQSICSASLEAQLNFTKRILQVVEELHNEEAAELARKSILMLSDNPSVVQVDNFRQLWTNFITSYDDSFLDSIGMKNKANLKEAILALDLSSISSKKIEDVNDTASLIKLASLLVSSFVPSIASSVNDEIANLSDKIRKKPSLLSSVSIEEEVKQAIKLRIALDKDSVKEMIESLDGVLDKLSLRLIEMIERSDNSTSEIQSIKKELEMHSEESDSAKTNFKIAHKKLYTLAIALEENTKSLSKDLQDHSGEVRALSKKIKKLEAELEQTKQESKEDFLTKLYNKRALDEFMNIKEAEFSRYGHNYSIIMFDIDFFKKVNDTFGHDAGDAVLSAFAQILKKEARTVDVIGRFGGEEFMAILSETDTKGGAIFAEKVRKHVEKARFMYKGERISVTVSSGVSERKTQVSLDRVVKQADDRLYIAKETGRNKVIYK